MDDQNQTNQPIVPGTVPVVPSVPEDITPVETPVTTTTTTTTIPETVAPTAVPEWQAPSPTPETVTTTTTTVTTPVPEEQTMPEGKPKKKIFSVIGAVAALLLVVGVAGAAYYVSNQLSTRQAVAPNAPESKPAAESCSYSTETECNQHNCGVGCYWSSGSCHMSVCGSKVCYGGLDCGSVCCDKATQLCCSSGCVTKSSTVTACPTATPTIGCYHYPDEVAGDNATVCTPIDRTKLSDVTFATAGTIRIHQEGMIDPGTTITLTKGTETISATKVSDGNYDAVVSAGTYKVTVKLGFATEGGQESLGFMLPNASNKCGRYLYDSAKIDISSLKTASALTSYGISTTTGVNIPWQCWADRIQGEDTNTVGQLKANYDFDDFRLVIGYKAVELPEVGACSKINIYKKVGTTFSTTAMTDAELQNLKVGDVLMLYSRSNNENLKGRFKISIDGVEGEWVDGIIDGSDKTVHSYSYTIAKAGTYKFEAQVTTVP